MLYSRFLHVARNIVVVLLYLFLLAPLFPVLIISFSSEAYLSFPPAGWSMRWYWALLENQTFIAAMRLSVLVAVTSTILGLAAGIPAAFAIARLRLPGRDLLLSLFTAPLVVPSIVLGLGLLLIFVMLRMNGSVPGLVAAHTMIVSPFVIRILLTGFLTIPNDVEAAAASLGAPPLRVFTRITLPLLRPAIIGATLLSFLISFDEVAMTLFLTGTSSVTLPIAVYRYTAERTDPQIAALAVLLILFSIILMFIIERVIGLTRAIGK